MQPEITAKRGLFFILVIATMVIFVGLVWVIAKNVPWDLLNSPASSPTTNNSRALVNCTYPLPYWKQHPELYPPQLVLGNETYLPNDIEGILSEGSQDASRRLQTQLVGVFLNISAGADQVIIEAVVFQSYGWLEQHPDGSQVSDNDLEVNTRLYRSLEAYNLGLAGVAACPGASSYAMTEVMTPLGTLSFLSTVTPTETSTPTPSETPTPMTSAGTLVIASQTPRPTTEPPGGTTDTPEEPTEEPTFTATHQPSPTNTAVKTTAAPTPTFTQPPVPTATFTLPPIPTATYTPPPPP